MMTATLEERAKRKLPREVTAKQQAAAELVRLAKEGVSSTGPDGLPKLQTKSVMSGSSGVVDESVDHGGGDGGITEDFARAAERFAAAS